MTALSAWWWMGALHARWRPLQIVAAVVLLLGSCLFRLLIEIKAASEWQLTTELRLVAFSALAVVASSILARIVILVLWIVGKCSPGLVLNVPLFPGFIPPSSNYDRIHRCVTPWTSHRATRRPLHPSV
jgi:hypothetical protein